MTPRRLVLVLVAALLGAAAGPVAAGGPAVAASGYCARGTGVTVVVDNGSLGGGTSVRCDPQGANTSGSTVVPRSGYPLTYVQRQPGFVCRVGGAPASANCVGTPPSDAYWGLFWSDGKSGTWSYASVGIGSIKVPAGGFIGWRFQGGTRTDPGTAPVSPKAAPSKASPTPKPSRTPTPSTRPAPLPSAPASTGATAGSAGAAATASERTRQERSTSASASATARQRAEQQDRKQDRNQTRKQDREQAENKARDEAADRDAKRKQQSAGASPDGTSSPSAAATTDPGTDLVAGDQKDGSGGGPLLPLVAGGLLLVLLAAVGRLAWVRRRG